MLKLLPADFVWVIIVLSLYLEDAWGTKKPWEYKSMKKLSKSEVDIKTYLLPCSIDEESVLNSSVFLKRKQLHNCKKKLVLKMTINSGGEYCSKSDGLIPIDHVIDGTTGRKKRLLNPMMIRIKREKMYQIYDLQLVKSVNAEAKEEVINYENTPSFEGCDTSSSHPTCGFSFLKNKMIQFSEGFCCSCDQAKNDLRQPCESRLVEGKSSENNLSKIQHHRSNRALDATEPKLVSGAGAYVEKDKKSMQYDLTASKQLLKGNLVDVGNSAVKTPIDVRDSQHYNVASKRNISLLGNSKLSFGAKNFFDNVTVRMFQFDHKLSPQDLNNDQQYTMSQINIAIDSEPGSRTSGENLKYRYSPTPNNSLQEKQYKLLMMNEIQQNYNNEVLPSIPSSQSVSLHTLPKYTNISHYKIGSLNKKQRRSDFNSSELPISGKGSFSLKLASGDNELDIQIVTKKPKIVSYSQTYNDSSKSNSNENNNTDKFQSMENFVYKFVPIINTASEQKNSDMINLILKDTDNSTEKVKMDLKKYVYVDESRFDEFGNLNIINHSILPNLKSNNSLKDLNILDKYGLQKKSLKNQQTERISQQSIAFTSPQKLVIDYKKQEVEKREVEDVQIRGGQSCCQEGKEVPPTADPDNYFDSAHCLRFSDLWYNVHKLVNPRMENSITIKIYAKHKTPDKKVCWENLTKGLPGKVGTVDEVLRDDTKNIVLSYSSDDKVAFTLDCSSDYLLVPQPLPKRSRDSELKELSCGGPGEYLVLKENEIVFDGEECDHAGVSYAAFARQPHRCQRPVGTCLKNQPLQFWRDDKKAASRGKKGQYFLSNFITVSDQVILQNTTGNQVVLRAPYYMPYQSHIVVELNADHLHIISDRSEGQITEVYIDGTSEKVVLKAVITNLGIAADHFGIYFANCSSPLGPSDFDKPGRGKIPPQHRVAYTVTISSPFLQTFTECNLVLSNVDQEIIASRHITIVRGQRCMCVWHCQCVCHNYPRPGLLCKPLSIPDYNRAGFPGQLPIKSSPDCSIFFTVVQGLMWVFLLLLLFGMIKALLGLCFSSVAVYGLWYILPYEAKCLQYYREPHLNCYQVVHDEEDFAINPKTFKRNVHFLPWFSEFSMNVFFFICAARVCTCDNFSWRANSVIFSHNQCQPMVDQCGRRVNHYPVGCSARHEENSLCGSVCSNRRKMRLAAGGESQLLNSDPQTFTDQEAKRYVNELIKSYVVFRNFSRPIGGVHAVPNTPYCVRGFFLESENGIYQFDPPSPLMQIWQMDETPLEPPVVLDPTPFRVMYRSVQEVLAARELSPWPRGVVINAP